MDNSEISSTSKLAASLVVIAAVLGMSIGVFKIAKGTSSDGVTEFHKAINTVSESQFTDYDNSVLNGSQIISAWNKFDGENVAVLLGSVQDIEASKLVSDDYYEYVGKQDAALYWDKDSWVSNFGFADKNGKVLVNSDTDNIKRSATLEYIKPNAKFQCNLVKANTGEILGIAFEEVG